MPTTTDVTQREGLQLYFEQKLHHERLEGESAEDHMKRIVIELLESGSLRRSAALLAELVRYTQQPNIRELYWDALWDDASSVILCQTDGKFVQSRRLRPAEEIVELIGFDNIQFHFLYFLMMDEPSRFSSDIDDPYDDRHPFAKWLAETGLSDSE